MRNVLQMFLTHKLRLVVVVVVVVALSYAAWFRFSDDRDGTSTIPELITDPGNTTEAVAVRVGSAGSLLAGEQQVDGRLVFTLSDGSANPDAFEPLVPSEGTRLSQDDIDVLLARLPELTTEPNDQEAFRLPELPLPPPRPGVTIPDAFPPRPAVSAPPTVEDAPLQVLRFAPEGEIPLAPFLSVTFNQPMVPLATIETLSEADVPVTLTPDLPGVWRWLGTQTLTFEYDGEAIDRFPMATEYVAEIPAGTTSVSGNRLPEAVSWRFSTPPVSLQNYYPANGPQPLEPIIFIGFDQQIDADAVLETIEVTANDRVVPVQLATDDEVAADERVKSLSENARDGRWLAIRSVDPLPTSATIDVVVGPNTPSAEGPLLSEEAASFDFFTYDPLQVEEHRCGWYDDECPPFTPFRIEFNNPLDMDVFTPDWVKIEPALPGATVQAIGSALHIQGATRGNTRYVVTVDGAIQDIFGQTLGNEEVLRFRVGSAPEALSGPDQSLVTLDPSASNKILSVYTVNYDRLEVRAYAVEPSDWEVYLAYRDQYYYEETAPVPPGREIMNETISIDAESDAFTEVPIQLNEAIDEAGGHLIVVVQPPNVRDSNRYEYPIVQTWVQSTRIGLDAFFDSEQLFVWATDLQSGSPLSDVTIELLPGNETTKSDSDGLASFDLGSGGLLVATQGDDSAILPASPYYWDEGGWQSWSRPDEYRWYVFDDRQMYKPGEVVHLKGWVRQVDMSATGDIGLPTDLSASGSYMVMDGQWNEIENGRFDINELGGFDLTFTIPENSNLGFAQISFTVDGHEYWHNFQIQEFRRPEFEVSARTESMGPYFVGQAATVAASANYFAGGTLPNADVEWQVCANSSSYSPPNWPDFTFGTWTPWWYDFGYYEDVYYEEAYYVETSFGDPFGAESSCQSFSGKTDAGGEDYLRIDFDEINKPQPFTLSANATVFDVNRQAWTASTNLLLHPAALYVGLRGERAFVRQGQPLEIEVIVTDIDGEAVVNHPLTVTAARQAWLYRAGRWVEEAVDVQECILSSTATPATCSFETTEGGTYVITAVVSDDQDRSNQSELTRWVSGGQKRPARNVEQEVVTLIPDKAVYEIGDTAEILVQSPFGAAEGMMSVSRGPLLYNESFTVDEEGYVLMVPINEEHLPDLTVQVDLVGASVRTDDAGNEVAGLPPRPAFATGRLMLNVSTESRRLTVDVSPVEARLAPGSETAVDVRITDGSGQPVSGAELAVVVVDEAVLALSNYQLRDPLGIFYTSRGSSVGSVYGRNSIILANVAALADEMQLRNEQLAGGFTDDAVTEEAEGESIEMLSFSSADEAAPAPEATFAADGAARVANQAGEASTPIRIRSDFNPLAVFAPTVRSDGDGQARVAVPLPDNLTRYRIMVVAVADGQQFGSGEANLTARLPLMVRPSAPRFLNFGDTFELPVVLQNQTDSDMMVSVVAQASNVTFIDGLDGGQVAGQEVNVPANDRVELRFPATTLSAGTARFQLAAAAGEFADAATVVLPVYTPATTEAFATYGVVDEGAIGQPVAPPEGVFSQFGGLEIQTSSTALQALTDAVLYLTEYPYDYAEPLASRILAVAALRDVLTAFEAEGMPEPAVLEAVVQGDIERLEQLQNRDGGWPIWRRNDESVPYYTIHVAYALQMAQEKGFVVSESVNQQALNYLIEIESHYPHWYGEQTRRSLSAYALFVRYEMGDVDANKAAKLLGETTLEAHSLETLAWLWPILADEAGYSSEVEAIGNHFNNRVVETAAAANFTTSYGDEAYLMLHSNRRTDGIILNSLIAVQPESDLIPKVVNGLLADQIRGRWRNTQENVFILLAMDRYFNTFEAQTPEFVARIWLGDTYAGEHAYEGRTTERHETVVPMSYLVEAEDVQALVLDKEGVGRLYYRLGLSYAPSDLDLDPLDMGFVVQRRYEGVDDPEDVYQDEDGRWHIRAGARVRVRLTMVTSNRRYHVALVDPLPAGLEIINPALAVSGDVPQDPNSGDFRYGWWWWGTWYQHQNMRDERAEAFTTLLWDGVYNYSYVARATTPGTFTVPPAKAEEMYSPEVFGRSGSDWVVVE